MAADDVLAIEHLVARYCLAVCRRDEAAWAATWAEDGRWDLGGGRVTEGRDAIVAAWRQAMGAFTSVVHTAHNGAIDVEGDTARGRWIVTERLRTPDGRALTMAACYDDRYVRTAEGWRFAVRALELLDHEESAGGPPR